MLITTYYVYKYRVSQTFLIVFQSKDHQWTCIQQRSPTIKGKRQVFLDNMTQFAAQFSKVVILTSMDATRRLDSQIQGIPFRVYGEGALTMRAVTLGVPVLENIELEEESTDSEDKRKIRLPGSGLARHLYDQLSANKIDTTLLIMFALEGGKTHTHAHILT
jgi:hypothetical protein